MIRAAIAIATLATLGGSPVGLKARPHLPHHPSRHAAPCPLPTGHNRDWSIDGIGDLIRMSQCFERV